MSLHPNTPTRTQRDCGGALRCGGRSTNATRGGRIEMEEIMKQKVKASVTLALVFDSAALPCPALTCCCCRRGISGSVQDVYE